MMVMRLVMNTGITNAEWVVVILFGLFKEKKGKKPFHSKFPK